MNDNRSWKIVLIDDETDILDVTQLALADAGYQVATAEDGQSGLDLCRGFKPRIVITDIRMPGLSGLDVLEQLKKDDPNVEVIVVTAFTDMDVAIKALRLDASDFITKPINNDALHMAVNRARERYVQRSELRDYTRVLEQENARNTKELLHNLDFQKKLIQSSMDGILGCDGDGKVRTFNQSLADLTGRSAVEVIGNVNLQHFFDPDDFNRFMEDLAGDRFGGPRRLFLYESKILDSSGQRIPVQMSAVTFPTADPGPGLVLFIRDLREIRRLERDMADQARTLHQDKMMSLGRLAASVAHEINNPLSGILNYLRLMIEILHRGSPEQAHLEKFRQYLELVEAETTRCSRIVSGLLIFSRKSAPCVTEIDVSELLNRCLLLARHKLKLQNIEVHLDCPRHLPVVKGDFNELQQCVINLVFNAMDVMPDGGRLHIESYFQQETNNVLISIRDTGPGISEEHRPHIFEPFFTTKKEGAGVGLGLSTVFGIMERHGGRITLESESGRGTTFFLLLPVGSSRS
jgi:two-component system, NtrC family, sensor kinase